MFQVTNQVTQEGSFLNRYDVTLLVNGLPLVQIELKRRGIEIKEAFNQINRYQNHSFWSNHGLFQYVQLFVICNGGNTKYLANNNLQYSIIIIVIVLLGIGIVSLVMLNIPERVAEGLIFFTFLLFFEFLLVLLDSQIEAYSGGEPAWKLLFNAVLAGMIFPLHSFFETKLKSRLGT